MSKMATSSATKGRQMKPIPHPDIATGLRVPLAVALAAVLGVSGGLIVPANAQTFSSSYTSTAPKDCRVVGAGNGVDDSTTRVCPGKEGLVVLVSEDDLRETVSVGRNRAAAAKEPAAQAWFGPFNSTTTTVEWRALDGKLFAIIQRRHIADKQRPGQGPAADRQADAGSDSAAAGRCVPCRLYRREGQSQCQ
jgi:hypothetical protein